MAEIVNLRRFRKNRQRKDAETEADRNRILHGRTKAERDLAKLENARASRAIEAHKREDGNSPGSGKRPGEPGDVA